MQIKVSFKDLPDAKDWEDGENYELDVRQVSHDKDGVTLEITKGEPEEIDEEDGEEEFSRM